MAYAVYNPGPGYWPAKFGYSGVTRYRHQVPTKFVFNAEQRAILRSFSRTKSQCIRADIALGLSKTFEESCEKYKDIK